MTSVIATLETHDAADMFGEHIDDFTFAFIAPLRADDDDVFAHFMSHIVVSQDICNSSSEAPHPKRIAPAHPPCARHLTGSCVLLKYLKNSLSGVNTKKSCLLLNAVK